MGVSVGGGCQRGRWVSAWAVCAWYVHRASMNNLDSVMNYSSAGGSSPHHSTHWSWKKRKQIKEMGEGREKPDRMSSKVGRKKIYIYSLARIILILSSSLFNAVHFLVVLRWWYTLCYYSFRHSTFNDIHNTLVAHVVYTRPQNVVTKSSGFAYTIIT